MEKHPSYASSGDGLTSCLSELGPDAQTQAPRSPLPCIVPRTRKVSDFGFPIQGFQTGFCGFAGGQDLGDMVFWFRLMAAWVQSLRRNRRGRLARGSDGL